MGKLESVKEACFSPNAIQIGIPTNAVKIETLLNQIITLVNELKMVMSEHVHGGVTAGTSNTAAAATITSPSPVEISNVV